MSTFNLSQKHNCNPIITVKSRFNHNNHYFEPQNDSHVGEI